MHSQVQLPVSDDHLATINVLGSRVHLISLEQTVNQIEHWIRHPDGQCHRVIVTGFHGIWEGHEDPGLRGIMNDADLWVPDGIAPVLVARVRGHRNVERVPGMRIMCEFLKRANVQHYSSYFYGDTAPTLERLRRKLTETWPGHRISGMFSPPFRPMTPEEDQETLRRIADLRPDILWVGLGAPKQDRWIYDRLASLKVPVAIGVGAAFRFIAGTVQACPDWLGRMGLEWAYRLAKEPRKLWRRDLVDGPQFLFHVALEMAGLRKYQLNVPPPRTALKLPASMAARQSAGR